MPAPLIGAAAEAFLEGACQEGACQEGAFREVAFREASSVAFREAAIPETSCWASCPVAVAARPFEERQHEVAYRGAFQEEAFPGGAYQEASLAAYQGVAFPEARQGVGLTGGH